MFLGKSNVSLGFLRFLAYNRLLSDGKPPDSGKRFRLMRRQYPRGLPPPRSVIVTAINPARTVLWQQGGWRIMRYTEKKNCRTGLFTSHTAEIKNSFIQAYVTTQRIRAPSLYIQNQNIQNEEDMK